MTHSTLFWQCKNLVNKDMMSKSDPMVIVNVKIGRRVAPAAHFQPGDAALYASNTPLQDSC